MEKLSQVLWRERDLLELLLYRLEVEQLVMASGRTTWLMRAAREVEQTLETLRETEVLRAVAADEAASLVGLPPNPSLSALAEACEEPWHTILLDHREAFHAVTGRISAMADANRELISAGYRSARETLLALSDDKQGYAHDGSVVGGPAGPRLVDRSL
nr:flagellar export chaperone FlgN [Nocardioides sp. TRM66260-LWL]